MARTNQFAHGTYTYNHVCGCYFSGQFGNRSYFPQVRLESHATINPVCFTTELTQTFHNPNSEEIPQCRYTFPLFDGVAVNGYTISYADKVLRGIVKQKDVAKQTYQAAVDRGETAGLLESLPAGVFGVTLGNVPPKTDIIVQIAYCGELKHDAGIDGLRYMLPNSIAPRYGNYPGQVLQSNTVNQGGIKITVDVDMAKSTIWKAQSPSHPIALSMGELSTSPQGSAFSPSRASVTLTQGSTELDDDFILQLVIDEISKPQAIVETHPALPEQRAIMTTLVPKFVLEPAHPEIIFIADQSGSMRGTKNQALVSALKVFLKSLPLGVRFNICAFGSAFQFLWPKSQAYSEDSLQAAIDYVDSFAAHYGGTEILKPIKAAFERHLSDLPLEVMLLTDGEIWGEDHVFSYINEQIGKGVDARVFALGIGQDVSHTLVEGVARAGNGFAQFVTEDEEIDQKVIRMLKGALYAHTTDYSLEVTYGNDSTSGTDDDFEIIEKVNDCLVIDEPAVASKRSQDQAAGQQPKSFFDISADLDKPTKIEANSANRYAHLPSIDFPKVLQAPSKIPSLFPFDRTTAYLLLGPKSTQKNILSVTLRALSPEGPLELTIPIEGHQVGTSIHQLAARRAIQDLQEGRGWLQSAKIWENASVKEKFESRFDEIVERECVRLGEKFQVASKWTSFVAAQDHAQGELQGPDVEEEIAPGASGPRRGKHLTNARKTLPFAAFGGSSCVPQAPALAAPPFPPSAAAPPPYSGMPVAARMPNSPFACFGNASSVPQAPALAAPPATPSAAALPQHQQMPSAARMHNSPFTLFGNSSSVRQAPALAAPPVPPSAAAPPPYLPMAMAACMPMPAQFDVDLMLDTSKKKKRGGLAARTPLARRAARVSAPAPAVHDFRADFPAAPSTEGVPNPHGPTMHKLIGLQTFSGAWVWNEEFLDLIVHGGDDKDGQNIDRTKFGNDADSTATALAIAFLEQFLSEKKDVWEMVASKARGWLAKQLGVNAAKVEELVRVAAGYL
ncbi:Hypothetical predicted protein [Lecanosticta acicola]|uniref:Uncharacterized protein n=1 Tax=Lecanosticta acicola TaxID=111012 RepID=A0AAI8Z4Z2_9PEZI|nr:Hypothetical predicted protein [Lecanosticta acicola]